MSLTGARTWDWGIKIDGNAISLADVETEPVRSVSQIELAAAAFEGLAEGMHRAAEGFMANARRSAEAPIDADVLARLRGVASGAEEAARAAKAFRAAFADRYGPDVRAAQAARRMDNPALTG
jgi:hypothetical protein